ncbi:GNAT family N-acetyltransferase [Echinicola marina]|uniref:GNAT family N-acetyltransferase n=1 Tax=Echinicola marina TaxID=2859768 RepID=UPI001CF6BA4F|nr:GNAT family N-acetyltransferase [Echinicola marina]UCS92967.1 GNAT family N-acetyltransferase [Echinicola marina]
MPDFLARWDKLYESCEWSTVFQSRKFVCAWYETYSEEYTPIMVIDESEHELKGLLAMTVLFKGKDLNQPKIKAKIVGAGHYDAEYQSWLAHQNNSDDFITSALELIKSAFPQCDIYFRYLIPQVPMNWLEAKENWNKNAVKQAYKRPLVRMDDPEIGLLFKKKEFKNKHNRLKRLGNLSFEKIINLDEFNAILPILIEQFEFRQLAMFNKSQFSDKPEKVAFLKKLFELGLLHTTILKVDDDIVASILGLKEKNWYHLGAINTHSPIYGNHSPGFVHFILLCELLSHESNMKFDLTPGGDAYKERMANDHDFVTELCIPHNAMFKRRQFVKYQFHKYLMKFNVRPMSLQLSLKKAKYDFKHWFKSLKAKGVVTTLSKLQLQNANGEAYLHILHSKKKEGLANVKMDSLQDLLYYEENQKGTSSWDFLKDAMLKFAHEFHAITWVENGKLLGYAWLAEPDRWEKVYQKQLPASEKHPVVVDMGYHPAAKDQLGLFLMSIAQKIQQSKNNNKVILSISHKEKQLLQKVEELASAVS